MPQDKSLAVVGEFDKRFRAKLWVLPQEFSEGAWLAEIIARAEGIPVIKQDNRPIIQKLA
jgi:hypothetical protein